LHGRVVDALLGQFSDEAAIAPEVVARHAEAAARMDVAVEYYRRAALGAQERSAHEDAIAHFQKAVDLLGADGGPQRDRLELSLQLGLGASLTAVRGYAHPDRRIAYERAHELGDAVGDAMLLGQALIGVSISACTSGAMESARSMAVHVLESAQDMGDDELALHAHSQIALSEIYQGRFESSLQHCERALALYDVPRHHKTVYLIGGDTGLSAMGVSAWNLWHLGYPDQALARARETVALARRLEDPFSLGFSTMVQGTIHWLRGEFDAQEQAAADEVAIGKKYSFPVWLGLGEAIRGAARVALGNATAVSELESGVALIAESGIQSGGPMLLAMVAATKAAAGSFEEALSAVDLAFAVSAATGQAFQDAELHRLKGELVIVAGRKSGQASERAAEESFRTAVNIARAQGARSFELRATTSLARLLFSKRRIQEARELLEPVYGWFEEGLDTEDLRRGRAALDGIDEASTDRVALPVSGKVG
jgi:tetratricopeptide (TPR) repeat protein